MTWPLLCQVFKATMKEDFKDIVRLLPQHTKLPASKKMMYLVARLELRPATSFQERLALVNEEGASMADAIGPAVGCLMATCGTNMISSCIFQYDDPEDLKEFAVEERLELWGLQVRLRYPHLLGRVSVCIIRAGRMVGAASMQAPSSHVHATLSVCGRAASLAACGPCFAATTP